MPVDPYADAPRLPEGAPLDLGALVPGTGPLELEIGPGRGWFIIERLAAEPTVRVVGLEIRRKWATIVDRRLAARGLAGRARVFAEDARLVVPRLAAASLDVVYLHFPDPWWKKRHEKRRVLGDELLLGLAVALRPGGLLFIQTDVADRAELYAELVAACPAFEPAGTEGPRLDDHPFVARSPRERRAMTDGLPITRLLWRRR